mgnify:CR=1 FL=1
MNEYYTCPMCRGEGKVITRTFADEQAPARLVVYALTTAILFAGSALLYHVTTPRIPTPVEQCAASCTPARFKTYTEPVGEATERTKGAEPNLYHPAVPGKCECLP